MYKCLYQFLDTFEVLYPLQFGFREKYSTTHAFLCLRESIQHSIDDGNFGCGIFLNTANPIEVNQIWRTSGKLNVRGASWEPQYEPVGAKVNQ